MTALKINNSTLIKACSFNEDCMCAFKSQSLEICCGRIKLFFFNKYRVQLDQ